MELLDNIRLCFVKGGLEIMAGTGYDKKTSSRPKSRLHPHGHRSIGRDEPDQCVQEDCVL